MTLYVKLIYEQAVPLPCSKLDPRVHSNHSQQYSVVTWFCTTKIFLGLICAAHLETSRQFVASVLG